MHDARFQWSNFSQPLFNILIWIISMRSYPDSVALVGTWYQLLIRKSEKHNLFCCLKKCKLLKRTVTSTAYDAISADRQTRRPSTVRRKNANQRSFLIFCNWTLLAELDVRITEELYDRWKWHRQCMCSSVFVIISFEPERLWQPVFVPLAVGQIVTSIHQISWNSNAKLCPYQNGCLHYPPIHSVLRFI